MEARKSKHSQLKFYILSNITQIFDHDFYRNSYKEQGYIFPDFTPLKGNRFIIITEISATIDNTRCMRNQPNEAPMAVAKQNSHFELENTAFINKIIQHISFAFVKN